MSTSAGGAVPVTTKPTISTPTSTSSASISAADTLSMGAKAGIGIGTTALAVCVLGLGFVFYFWRRRAVKPANEDDKSNSNDTACFSPGPYQMPSPGFDYQSQNTGCSPNSHTYHGHDPNICSWGAGYKSELPAELQYTGTYRPGPAELPVENISSEVAAEPVEAPAAPLLQQHMRAMRSVSSVSPSDAGTIDPSTSESMSDVSSLHTGTSPSSQAGMWGGFGSVLPLRDGAGVALTPIYEGRGQMI